MTSNIRRLHLFAWLALAILLPALIFAAVWLRHAEPVNDSVPARTKQTK